MRATRVLANAATLRKLLALALPTCLQADVHTMQKDAAVVIQLVAARRRRKVEIELIRGQSKTLDPDDVVASPEISDVRQGIEARDVALANKGNSSITARLVP